MVGKEPDSSPDEFDSDVEAFRTETDGGDSVYQHSDLLLPGQSPPPIDNPPVVQNVYHGPVHQTVVQGDGDVVSGGTKVGGDASHTTGGSLPAPEENTPVANLPAPTQSEGQQKEDLKQEGHSFLNDALMRAFRSKALRIIAGLLIVYVGNDIRSRLLKTADPDKPVVQDVENDKTAYMFQVRHELYSVAEQIKVHGLGFDTVESVLEKENTGEKSERELYDVKIHPYTVNDVTNFTATAVVRDFRRPEDAYPIVTVRISQNKKIEMVIDDLNGDGLLGPNERWAPVDEAASDAEKGNMIWEIAESKRKSKNDGVPFKTILE